MIRDPSDGTVKEINPDANKINEIAAKKVSEEITSGLPMLAGKPDETARLNKARAWLKDYHAKPPSRGRQNEVSV